ncbi:hypothetical protein [Nonomuraea dietziae]|uniref:hypothetical protein n=1 Tax=Nonomuraea dietziae TaxID=65515 RepID=UPI0033D74C39
MNDMVSFKLANPIGPYTCEQLGIPPKEHPVGATLTLPRQQALRLVSAGLVAGADPQDIESVQKALKPVKAKPAPSDAAS